MMQHTKINKCHIVAKQNKEQKLYHHLNFTENLTSITDLKKLGIQGTCLNIINSMNDKSKNNFILNRKNTNSFPLKSRMRHVCLLFPLLSNVVLEFLVRTVRQEKK
jgi:hypothetical protein